MTQSPSKPQGSRLISRVLPVAVKFWLQTQLDEIGDLTFDIQATDRQVLSGQIPGLALAAQQAVYQGVRLTDISAQASHIEINIGQVLRGKPLRLKQAFPIEGQVVFDGDDLAASSNASVLADGLLDFWQTLLAKDNVVAEVATHYGPDTLALQDLTQYRSNLKTVGTGLELTLMRQEQSDICLHGNIDVDQGHILRLATAQWRLPSGQLVPSEALRGFGWNLGEQTDLQSLVIENNQLICQCRIMVQP
ncbi:MAG: DUF2993 domain-containing protein [Cyanobacteria bacterium P01_A01_bin.137]